MPVTADTFRLAFEAAPVGMMTVDAGAKVTFANAQIERMFGYSREELLGSPLDQLIPGFSRSGNAVRKGGSQFPVELSFTPLTDEDLMLVSVLDITERQRSMRQLNERTAELTESLRGQDVLLREVHHRVKNNLQVISSLINIQVRKLEPGAPRDVRRPPSKRRRRPCAPA